MNGIQNTSASGRRSSATGSASTPNTTQKSSRKGNSNSQSTAHPLRDLSSLTRGCLEEFRGAQLVGRTARIGGRKVGHRAVRDRLLQALDDRSTPSRPLRFREADRHAEPDEERQDEDAARQEPLQEPADELDETAAHDCPSTRPP